MGLQMKKKILIHAVPSTTPVTTVRMEIKQPVTVTAAMLTFEGSDHGT